MFPSYQSNKIIFEADENCKNVIELRNVGVFFFFNFIKDGTL